MKETSPALPKDADKARLRLRIQEGTAGYGWKSAADGWGYVSDSGPGGRRLHSSWTGAGIRTRISRGAVLSVCPLRVRRETAPRRQRTSAPSASADPAGDFHGAHRGFNWVPRRRRTAADNRDQGTEELGAAISLPGETAALGGRRDGPGDVA